MTVRSRYDENTADAGLPATGAPAPGTTVLLLDQIEGSPVTATVETWSAADGGLVISTRLAASPETVERFADHRVWVSLTTDRPGYSVFGGIARAAGERALDVTGIAPLVREARRNAPRAAHDETVTVTGPGRRPRDLRAVDLSRGGVRVAIQEPADLTAGDHVTVKLHLDGTSSVLADGEVSRVDTEAGQAVVRFQNLADAESTRLDRFLLQRMTRPS